MNVEEFREYCLSLSDVTEATPFERFLKGKFTILVFYVNSHMFCYFNVDDFSNITIKCHPSEMAELKEHHQAIGEPFNGDKRYWISVQPNMDMHDEELKELVRKSYELVKAAYKRKKSEFASALPSVSRLGQRSRRNIRSMDEICYKKSSVHHI